MLNVQILIPLSNNLATPFSTQRASVLQDSTQTKAYTIKVMVLLVNPPVPLRFLHPHQQRQSTNNSSKKYNTLHRVRDNIRNLNHLKLFKYKIAKSRVSKIFLDQKRLCISQFQAKPNLQTTVNKCQVKQMVRHNQLKTNRLNKLFNKTVSNQAQLLVSKDIRNLKVWSRQNLPICLVMAPKKFKIRFQLKYLTTRTTHRINELTRRQNLKLSIDQWTILHKARKCKLSKTQKSLSLCAYLWTKKI